MNTLPQSVPRVAAPPLQLGQLIDRELQRLEVLWAAAGQPHSVYPETTKP